VATAAKNEVIDFDEVLRTLDIKVKQLKLDYEQYFAGARPREPSVLRSDVQKTILRHSNVPIQNTGQRFRFNSINSRFQAFKRQWDTALRQIENGTYKGHQFKAKLHEGNRPGPSPAQAASNANRGADKRLFESFVSAAKACGQNVSSLTPKKLQAVVKKQEAALKQKLGCERVKFKVVVQDGKVKLKASAVG